MYRVTSFLAYGIAFVWWSCLISRPIRDWLGRWLIHVAGLLILVSTGAILMDPDPVTISRSMELIREAGWLALAAFVIFPFGKY